MPINPLGMAMNVLTLSASGSATPWYLSGDIDPAHVLAAYQAVDAASLAASYVNLANPGTNDLTTANAPGWTPEGGWVFTGSAHLLSGITWQTAHTVIALINSVVSQENPDQFVVNAPTMEILACSGQTNNHYYKNGGAYLTKAGRLTSLSVVCIANNTAYLDGALEGTVPTGALNVTPVVIGRSSAFDKPLNGNILAIAFYNVALAQPEIQAVGAAMKALLIGGGDPPYQALVTNVSAATCSNAAGPLSIPTYDGSGHLVHPDVLDTGSPGWNGHRYWMVMTPYPNADDTYENPSIVVSDDNITWSVPEGLTNPLVQNLGGGSFWYDPDMALHNGVMYLVYCLRTADNLEDIVYLSTSTNGVTWAERAEILRGPRGAFSSPALLHNGRQWLLYHKKDTVYQRRVATSPGGPWSSEMPLLGLANPPTGWSHMDVIYDPGDAAYYGIFHSNDNKLYLSVSKDGLFWQRKSTPILAAGLADSWDDYGIYRASILRVAGGLDMWYTGLADALTWQVGYTTITLGT